MQTKVSLFNRTGHGWPDVIFSAEQNDVTSLADPTFHYAGALNGLIPSSVLNNFAKGSLPRATSAPRSTAFATTLLSTCCGTTLRR